jgi:spermidine synthase
MRFLVPLFAGTGLAPLITIFASRYLHEGVFPWAKLPLYFAITLAILAAAAALRWLLLRFDGQIESAASAQSSLLTTNMAERWVNVAIFASAALSLFLELAIIRWQATVFPFFSFYKNLSLLSCFAGLGLGYSLSRRPRLPLFLSLPILCWQVVFMMGMRYGLESVQFESLDILPFREQLNMGLYKTLHLYSALPTYFVLVVVFLLTALAFIPIGQLCGALMERREKLTAYGLNLLGSLAGVLLIFMVSALWAPPSVWFLLAFAALLCFQMRKPYAIAIAAVSAIIALVILELPLSPDLQRIYSPYQLLEVGHSDRGLMVVRAAGHYYQRVYDLLHTPETSPDYASMRSARSYYDFPYHVLTKPQDVAVVGAGTGNDVAAALRAGAGHIDAIEIDPAILMLGRTGHPEHPYDDRRVHTVVNDARSFLRTTDRRYDLIVFGLLDSHTLLSQASSVRLDSFVYTVQAMREARARLKPHGVISLAFSLLNDQLGRKIYLMLEQAFDGKRPICIEVGYDSGVVFLESEDPRTSLPADLITNAGFHDKTSSYANPTLRADVSTDDWPFFYMPQRVYPVSYLVMVALVLALSLALTSSFLSGRPQSQSIPFFLLGAGFMLVETKSITELGLTFGNSWQVVGLVIAGIMVMAYLANLAVQVLEINNSAVSYALLLLTLACGWWVANRGGLPSTAAGRIATLALLTSPLFFSGIIFSTLLKRKGEIGGAMSANLFGAMCGGLMEYNSMYFGFRFLYVMAAGLYLFAFAWELLGLKSKRKVELPVKLAA